jgi:hypothetical protein
MNSVRRRPKIVLGKLNLIFIIKLYRINLFFRLLQLDHRSIIYNIFLVYLRDYRSSDDCLFYIPVFQNKAEAI